MNRRTFIVLRSVLLILLIIGLVSSVVQPQSTVSAAAVLTISPLTWNVIGLDSNNVSVGPNNFPIGARVCNTGDAVATNVTSSFGQKYTFEVRNNDLVGPNDTSAFKHEEKPWLTLVTCREYDETSRFIASVWWCEQYLSM